jgi:protein required for attachment to host cells
MPTPLSIAGVEAVGPNRSKDMKKLRLWYVIADGGRARFVERDEEGSFRTLSSFVSTELHKSEHELGRDRPARVKESASPARSAVEPRRDLHEAAKEDFIQTVADTLASELKDGKFDELMLVAPPGVIAELKDSLSKSTAKVVVKELHKDLTKVPDHELTGHLSTSS